LNRPNILLIMTDQHHAGCVGYKGHPDVKTPHIDQLAAEGVRFDECFCANGVCVPSRVSYLTSMYCHAHGVYGNDALDIPDALLSLPRYLQTFGYQTALIGKKHLPGWNTHGFQYERVCYEADAPFRRHHYYQYLKQHGLHDLYDDLGDVERFCLSDRAIPVQHSLERWTGRETLTFLTHRDKDAPFFLMISFERPHPPLTVPEGCPFVYDPDSLTLPPNDREVVPQSPFFFDRNVEVKWCKSVHGEAGLREGLAAYYSLISLIDDEIGKVLTCLDEQGVREDTIIIFCADHGDFAGEYSKMAKGWQYDAIHRVPFVWSWLGKLKSGGPKRGLVETVDLFPTVCALLDVPVPVTAQGKDLIPLLFSDEDSAREAVFYEFVGVKTIRTKTHKLSYGYDGEKGIGELFDLRKDPHEYENLFDSPEIAPVREELLRRILNWWIETQQPPNFARDNEVLPPSRWFAGYPNAFA